MALRMMHGQREGDKKYKTKKEIARKKEEERENGGEGDRETMPETLTHSTNMEKETRNRKK